MAPLLEAATTISFRRASSMLCTPAACQTASVTGLVGIEPSQESLLAWYCPPPVPPARAAGGGGGEAAQGRLLGLYCPPPVPTACPATSVLGNMPIAVPSCGAMEY